MRRLLPLLLLLGCKRGADDTASDWQPDLHCPGSAGCEDADGVLEAGAAVVSIVPTCFETWEDVDGDSAYSRSTDTFLDCGCDRLCPEDEGWTEADEGEADETFQAVWMAGFGHARAAQGVRGAEHGLVGEGDGLWARAVVLRKGSTTLAIVTLDLVGWFFDDVLATRALIADAGLDVDHLLVHATHVHEGPDTMGIWGKSLSKSGYDPDYAAEVREATVEAVRLALEEARPVSSLVSGTVDVSTFHDRGVANVVRDTRDPWVIDPDLHAARLVDADGETIATLVNWANHPEALADDNLLLTSDYVHALRRTVEQGSRWETASGEDGVGGVALLLNGAVGGMMTPLGVTCEDPDGNAWSDASFEKADAIGQLVGEMALEAVATGTEDPDPDLSFRIAELVLPVDNIGFQAMFLTGVLDRELLSYDPSRPIDEDNLPEVRTELDVVDLGPIQMLTIPGELLPELAIGGYDGSHLHGDGAVLVDPDNPNPPDLSQAPAGPYLKDRMTGDSRWIVGLGNDELGYVIPVYDFVLSDSLEYLSEAEGDHYEETNSLGPRTAPLIEEQAARLLGWSP